MADLGMIALAFAFAIAAMVYTIGHISGCHINPAVTFSLAVTRRISWSEAVVYWVAQFLGGILGALFIALAFGWTAAAQGPGLGATNDVGDRTGKTFDEIKGLPSWNDDGFVAWPGGETLEQVLARTLGAVDRLTRESPGKTILIVGHGGVNRILLSHFLGILPKLDRTPGGNTSISIVHTDGKTHTVERLFATDHVSKAGPKRT